MQFTVSPQARRNAISFCGIALLILMLLVFLHLIRDDIPIGVSVVLGAASGIFMLLGIGKLIEPPVSLVITPEAYSISTPARRVAYSVGKYHSL